MAKIEVVNRNGDKQLIPEHWLDHPALGEGFKRSRRRQSQSPSAPRAAVTDKPVDDSKAGSKSANNKTAPGADQEG